MIGNDIYLLISEIRCAKDIPVMAEKWTNLDRGWDLACRLWIDNQVLIDIHSNIHSNSRIQMDLIYTITG